jgi:transposase
MHTLPIKVDKAEIEKLSYERYAYPQPMIQKRIFAVYLKITLGWSNEIIGLATGLHYNTVGFWINEYALKGFKSLLVSGYKGQSSALESYGESLLDSFRRQPPLTAAEAALRIKEMTGIERSEQQVRTFMKKHGLRCLKCGHIPAKADNEAQHRWVENTLEPALEAARKGEIHVLFCDAAHFVLQPFICFLWAAVRVFIKASAGRNRINVLGAVHAVTKEITTLINTTYINADVFMQFLKQLKEKFGDKPISIVLDNARYQHCSVVKNFAESLGISLLFLPPYSPNLNIIERLWKFTKKKILYAKYYNNPEGFHQAIKSFFNNINRNYRQELKSLLTLKFQFFDKENSRFYPL